MHRVMHQNILATCFAMDVIWDLLMFHVMIQSISEILIRNQVIDRVSVLVPVCSVSNIKLVQTMDQI